MKMQMFFLFRSMPMAIGFVKGIPCAATELLVQWGFPIRQIYLRIVTVSHDLGIFIAAAIYSKSSYSLQASVHMFCYRCKHRTYKRRMFEFGMNFYGGHTACNDKFPTSVRFANANSMFSMALKTYDGFLICATVQLENCYSWPMFHIS